MDPMDDLIVAALRLFLADLKSKRWKGRERDAVSMFAMGPLLEASKAVVSPLKDIRQIGIEVAVNQLFKKAATGGGKTLANKDLVIWKESCSTAWSTPSGAPPAALAVLEWKVDSDQKGKRNTVSLKEMEEMRNWLRGFARHSPEAIGYAIYLDLRSDPKKEHLLERYQGETESTALTSGVTGRA